MAFGVLIMPEQTAEQILTDKVVKQILPLLDGISYGQIEYILDKVKKEATCYPIKIELPIE